MILLISDLHLEEERPDITRAFLDLLHGRARGAQALYILGLLRSLDWRRWHDPLPAFHLRGSA